MSCVLAQTAAVGVGSASMQLRKAPFLLLVLVVVDSHPSAGQDLGIRLIDVASGLTRPIAIAHAGDGSDRLFIAQQTGEIRILSGGVLLATPFLDISSLVTCCGERGLLGLAFHPQYASTGFFYVHYSDSSGGDTVVARYQVSAANPDVANSGSARIVLTENQPFTNHNGGQLAFGPDGYLYVALGDGGSGGDPGDRAQDLSTLLGKILRVDVNGDDFPGDPDRNYAVPVDNPFVGTAGEDEIWAYGLRNPWRFSFDRLTHDLWIGDVGQSAWEEINFQPAASAGGENYGWDVLEGLHCFENDPGGDGSCSDFLNGASVLPVLEYAHINDPCDSITGGFRYRGFEQPRLSGLYFNADFCYGDIRVALPDCSGGFEDRVIRPGSFNIAAFGEDEAGELYVTEYANTDNPLSTLHRIIADPASGGPMLSPDPTLIEFDISMVGTSETVSVTLENTGTGEDNLVVESVTLTDDLNFNLDLDAGPDSCGAAPLCLAASDDCTLGVTFQPQREGGFDELLLLPANSVPMAVALQGIVPCTGPHGPDLSNNTITTASVSTDCHEVIVGPDLTVSPSGRLEVRAGESIAIVPPFWVEAGGGLQLVLDPALAQ